MNYFYAFCVCGIILNSIENGCLETTGPVWGSTSYIFLRQDQVSEARIPLSTRTATVKYQPSLSMARPMNLYGIEHINFVNKQETGCGDPIVEIHDGGISHTHVTIQITSQNGCPLDSVVNFYGFPIRT